MSDQPSGRDDDHVRPRKISTQEEINAALALYAPGRRQAGPVTSHAAEQPTSATQRALRSARESDYRDHARPRKISTQEEIDAVFNQWLPGRRQARPGTSHAGQQPAPATQPDESDDDEDDDPEYSPHDKVEFGGGLPQATPSKGKGKERALPSDDESDEESVDDNGDGDPEQDDAGGGSEKDADGGKSGKKHSAGTIDLEKLVATDEYDDEVLMKPDEAEEYYAETEDGALLSGQAPPVFAPAPPVVAPQLHQAAPAVQSAAPAPIQQAPAAPAAPAAPTIPPPQTAALPPPPAAWTAIIPPATSSVQPGTTLLRRNMPPYHGTAQIPPTLDALARQIQGTALFATGNRIPRAIANNFMPANHATCNEFSHRNEHFRLRNPASALWQFWMDTRLFTPAEWIGLATDNNGVQRWQNPVVYTHVAR